MRITTVPVMGPVIVVPCVGVSRRRSMASMMTVFGTIVARECIASTALMTGKGFKSGLVCEIVGIPIVTIIVRSE